MDCGIPLHVDADLESYHTNGGDEMNEVGNHGDVYEPQSPVTTDNEQSFADQSTEKVGNNHVQESEGSEENSRSLDSFQGQGHADERPAEVECKKELQVDVKDEQIQQTEGIVILSKNRLLFHKSHCLFESVHQLIGVSFEI